MTELIGRWSIRWMWLARTVIVLSLLIVIGYAADRRIPFRMLGSDYAEGHRGGTVVLRSHVWRDMGRTCSAEFARYVFDSAGSRFDLGSSIATDAMIRGMESKSPGRLIVAIEIPLQAAPGPARMLTSLQYRCNKVHAIWPIEATTELPFTVLP
jgi:hypothetical protein